MKKMVFINPSIDLLLIALAIVVFLNLLRAKFQSKELMDKVKEKNKQVKKLMKQKDKHSIKEMGKANKELMELNMQVMRKTMPITMISLVLFIIIFPFIRAEYEGYVFPLPVPLPWIDFQLHSQTNWLGYYFVASLTFSILIGLIKKIVEKLKKGD